MQFSILQVADWCAQFVETLGKLMERFTLPLRDWMFIQAWLPEHSLIGKLWYGVLDTFLGPFFNFSLLEIMLGAGLLVYILYQLVTWILNLIT